MSHLRYDYAGDRRLLEGADWVGRRPEGLRLHFHNEVQVSVIWSGYRDYQVGTSHVRLRPGQLLVTPPYRPHQAQPSLDRNTRSVELYVPADAFPGTMQSSLQSFEYLIGDEPDLVDLAPREIGEAVVARMAARTLTWRGPLLVRRTPGDRLMAALKAHDHLCDAASVCGLSREGFIRAFARSFGMTPHAFRVNDRLNLGRQQLRDGASIPDVAYESGFSDQSHFGRLFLQFFGATPGQFRAAHTLA